MGLLDRIEQVKEEIARIKEEGRREEVKRFVKENPAGTGLDAAMERKLEEAGLGKRGKDGKFELNISSGGESKG